MTCLKTAPPKSRQIADILRNEIENGTLQPGARVYSVRSLADQYGVSIAVIVSAFNILEKQNLIVREGGRGTFVSRKLKKTRTFGVVTTYTENGIEGYFEALHDVFYKHNSLPIVIHPDDSARFEYGIDIMMSQKPVALFADVEGRTCPLARLEEIAGDVPICFVNRWEWLAPPRAPAVLVDYEDLYYTAFKYFLGKDHQRIVVIGQHMEPLPYLQNRIENAAKKCGYTFPSPSIDYVWIGDFEKNRSRIDNIFGEKDHPTGILGTSDYATMVFMDQLNKIYSFKDLEPIGVYDTAWSRIPGKEFSSFRLDYVQIWEQVLSMFLNGKSNIQTVKWIKAERN